MKRKTLITQTKGIDEKNRTITFVMSTEDIDRDGDSIKMSGWNLDNFEKNSPFLLFHNSQQFPVGSVDKVWIDSKQLLGTVRFAEKGTYDQADIAFELYRQGIMKAVSVGFIVRDYEKNDTGGWDITEQELYELSAVPVPANPAALAIAKSFDRDVTGLFQSPGEEPKREPKTGTKETSIEAELLKALLTSLKGEDA